MPKSKFSIKYCRYCEQNTKMVLVNEIEGNSEKAWYRCPKCHHLALLYVSTNEDKTSEIQEKIQKDEYKVYKPEITYSVGEVIFHHDFNDYGKILKKDVTSDGNSAIVVKFEKLGERKLLENFKINTQSENNMNIINPNGNREEVN